MIAFGMPGPLEIIIILLILALLVGVPILVIVTVLVIARKSNQPSMPNPNLMQCGDCGAWISHQATACPQCGKPSK
jgi:hypothetical protein